MTISPRTPWGRQVERPEQLDVIHGDHELATALARRPPGAIGVGSGDLARTLGVTSSEIRPLVNELPIDLLEVRLDDATAPVVACAHVVARSPWARGGAWRGRLVAVMNAEFIGAWDVAPRGHPNDGRAEVFDVDPSMSPRQRFFARRRLRTATHVPHPLISTRSIRSARWDFPRPVEVIVDGRRVGRCATLHVDVLADAAIVHA